MSVPLLTKRDRRLLRAVVEEYPGLAEIIHRVETVAARPAVLQAHEVEQMIKAAELRADQAELRERNGSLDRLRLKRRIAELESRP